MVWLTCYFYQSSDHFKTLNTNYHFLEYPRFRLRLKLPSSGKKGEAPLHTSQNSLCSTNCAHLNSWEVPTSVTLVWNVLTALILTEKPAVSPQQMYSTVDLDASLLSDITTETLAAPLRPFKSWNRRRGRQAGWPPVLPLLPTKYFSLATVSWPAVGSVQWSTHMHTDRAVCLSRSHSLLRLPPRPHGSHH